MEKQIKFPLGNGKFLYGVLRGDLRNPLLIFVHGFTGNQNEHIFFNGARFLEKKRFSSFRFNLYDWTKDTRKLEECTLSLHAEDLDLVVDYFKGKGVQKIFVAGHSYGGLTVLLSKKQLFEAAVLWDPSIKSTSVTRGKYIEKLKRYYLDSNGEFEAFGITVGVEMVDENKKMKPLELMQKFTRPVKIIVAENGVLVNGGKKYLEAARIEKDMVVVKGASHCFDEDGTEEKLFEETLKWVQKFV